MPVMKEVVKIMIGEKESKKLNPVSLSKNTVKKRIVDMSNYVLEQILTYVKESPFYSIQLDECTDAPAFILYSLHQQCYCIRRFVILQSIEAAHKR